MENTARFSRFLFALPWFIFGLQHFIYAGFVANIVPAYMPLRSFWVYFTGTAMFAAAISLIVNKKSALASFLLGVMVTGFVLMIHTVIIAGNSNIARNWTRMWQDLSIAAAAFILAGSLLKPESAGEIIKIFAKIGRYVFAVMLIIFGVQHFLNLEFLTANVPVYLPLQTVWSYLVGIALVITGMSVLTNKKVRLTATVTGVLLLIVNLLFHAPRLAKDPNIGGDWTAAMIDLAITGGVFILASSAPQE